MRCNSSLSSFFLVLKLSQIWPSGSSFKVAPMSLWLNPHSLWAPARFLAHPTCRASLALYLPQTSNQPFLPAAWHLEIKIWELGVLLASELSSQLLGSDWAEQGYLKYLKSRVHSDTMNSNPTEQILPHQPQSHSISLPPQWKPDSQSFS